MIQAELARNLTIKALEAQKLLQQQELTNDLVYIKQEIESAANKGLYRTTVSIDKLKSAYGSILGKLKEAGYSVGTNSIEIGWYL